jgi:ribosome modulation factor
LTGTDSTNGANPGPGHNRPLTDEEYFSFLTRIDGAESDLSSALSNCREPRKRIKTIRSEIEARVGKAGLKAFDRAREDDKRPASERETEDALYRRIMRWLRKPLGTQAGMFDDDDVPMRPFTPSELDRIEAQGHQAGLDGQRMDSCPHNPGGEDYARWINGWKSGQAEAVAKLGEPSGTQDAPKSRGRPKGSKNRPRGEAVH